MHCNIQSITEYAVAPRVGAWIETRLGYEFMRVEPSHPEWVRGLKLVVAIHLYHEVVSHPEWVRGLKRIQNYFVPLPTLSHPEWVRGLKLRKQNAKTTDWLSHPEWVRGLKLATDAQSLMIW